MSQIRCVQPGERGLFRLERAFGRVRRWWLRHVRLGYVRKMATVRLGECPDCPHDIVDPRDLKLYQNVCGYHFPESADQFRWRDRLPFARQGLVEVTVVAGGGLLLAAAMLLVYPWLAIPPLLVAAFYLWFFRDPERQLPTDPNLVLAPCDGIVDEIREVEDCAELGGPAVRVGIFLSLFNVHINRAPCHSRVTLIRYFPGVFRNAMRLGDHSNNEQLWTVFEPTEPGGFPLAVRQIAGPMARTIVNTVRLGQSVAAGERFGMIKFGSRTELYFPKGSDYQVAAVLGMRVQGGVHTILRKQAAAHVGQPAAEARAFG